VRDGLLVHHGYERPGHGYIVGDCFGVGKPPHEVSPELAMAWQARVAGLVQNAIAALEPPQWPPQSIGWWDSRHWWHTLHARPGGDYVRLSRADIPVRDEQGIVRVSMREYESALDSVRRDTELHLSSLEREHQRITALVDTWFPRPLRTLEEEQLATAERKRRSLQERQEKREAKAAELVARYQQRIDSALRTRNANVLLQIYESAPSKLRDALAAWDPEAKLYRLTKFEAIAMIDRPEAWAALGLPTDYYVEQYEPSAPGRWGDANPEWVVVERRWYNHKLPR